MSDAVTNLGGRLPARRGIVGGIRLPAMQTSCIACHDFSVCEPFPLAECYFAQVGIFLHPECMVMCNQLSGDSCALKVRSHNHIQRFYSKTLTYCRRLMVAQRTEVNISLTCKTILLIIRCYSMTNEEKSHRD